MKNIIKTLIVMLSSISLFTSANAGELGVSGTAKATYNINSGANQTKGIGITNELNFTASGELDNGYTWSYSMELDPGSTQAATETTATNTQAAHNDDSKLTLTTPMGTVGVFISEGGLDLEDGASQSVYARPTDMGDPSATSDNFTIDSYNNIQYHTPADMLPFGITAKVAYATGLDAYGSGNNTGKTQTLGGDQTMGESATEYQVKAAPIDGLTVGASYMEFSGSGSANTVQEPQSGSYMATYASGPFSVGYSKGFKAPIVGNLTAGADVETVDYYDQTNMSIAYAATDDLSISYEKETSEANYVLNTTADVEQKSTSLQVAYTMGGMTIALAQADHENVGYSTASSADREQTLIAVTMAF
jgi:outer membrane protein OmpU